MLSVSFDRLLRIKKINKSYCFLSGFIEVWRSDLKVGLVPYQRPIPTLYTEIERIYWLRNCIEALIRRGLVNSRAKNS